MRLILLALCASACAPIHYEIDERVLPYTDKWVELYNIPIESHIRIKDITYPGVAGLCYHQSDRPNEIELDEAYWNTATNPARETLVFHELGHCLKGLGHDRRLASLPPVSGLVTPPLVPKSLMYPYIFAAALYEAHTDYYREELRYSTANERP